MCVCVCVLSGHYGMLYLELRQDVEFPVCTVISFFRKLLISCILKCVCCIISLLWPLAIFIDSIVHTSLRIDLFLFIYLFYGIPNECPYLEDIYCIHGDRQIDRQIIIFWIMACDH